MRTLAHPDPLPPSVSTPNHRWVADLTMLMVAIIWGLNNVVVKASLTGWVTPLAFNSVRFSLGAGAILLLAWRLEPDMRLPRHLWWKVALLGLIGNGLNQVLFINGIALSTASTAGTIVALIPIMVAILGALTGYDRGSGRLYLGALISFIGIALVALRGQPGATGSLAGVLLLFGGALAWAGYSVYAVPLTREASPIKVTAYGMSLAATALLAYSLPDLLRQDWRSLTPLSWAGALYAGLLSNTVGYGLYVWCIQRLGSSRAALWNNLSPIVTAIAAWWLLDERWVGAQWLGAGLVLIGVLTARWTK